MLRKSANVYLEEITGTDEQIKVLYDNLKSRNFGISHEQLPQYQEHVVFVKNHPYRYWAMVIENDCPVGTVYLKKDNSIGLNFIRPSKHLVSTVLQSIRDDFEPVKEVKSKIPSYFYVNVAYTNEKLNNILLELNAMPLQKSYKV